jgi:hypothetical protein
MSEMTKRLLLISAVALAVVPAALAASPDATKAASGACSALRTQLGATAFSQAYPTFGQCVSRYAQLEQQNVSSAEASCTALQADPNFVAGHGGKSFDQFYGTGKNAKNAFGNCVSAHATASSQAEKQGRMNPSRTCIAARSRMGTASFALTYGKTANDRNAFGKCVSSVAHAQSANELSAAASCKAQQSDSTFTASHSGRTFAQVYGTNDDDSNAYGKCVSAAANEKSTAQQQATVAAAKACRAELNAGAAAFNTKYGTFGRCVSQKAGSK